MALKDNINEMIRNLKDTTQKNSEQDWLKTNREIFADAAGQRPTVSRMIPPSRAGRFRSAVFYTLTTPELSPS